MVDLNAWESFLSAKLNDVELIGELQLSPELMDTLAVGLRSLLRHQTLQEATALIAYHYPCCLAVYLVASGIYKYRDGDFYYWGAVAETLGVRKQPLSQLWGGFFEAFLKSRGKPFFPEMGGFRYVGPILTHGGIPDYSLADFFGYMLAPAITRPELAAMEPSELIQHWLYSSQGRTDKPVRRFLEYGRMFAADFVRRALDMAHEYADHGTLPSAQTLGLPERVITHYREWVRTHEHATPRSTSRLRIHPPSVFLDPWGNALSIELPNQVLPLTPGLQQGSWEINDGVAKLLPFTVRRVGDELHSDYEQLPLEAPAPMWVVSLELGAVDRTWRFPGLTDDWPLLVFDPEQGELVRHSGVLPARHLWLLYDQQLKLHVEGGRCVEQLPSLGGAWAPYRIECWDLELAQELRIGTTIIRVEPDESRFRPWLKGKLVPGLGTTVSTLPIYTGRPPEIVIPVPPQRDAAQEASRWRVVLQRVGAGEKLLLPIQALPHTVRDDRISIQLEQFIDPATYPAALYDVALRGPLGRDSNFRFGFVTTLTVRGDTYVRLPDEHGLYSEPLITIQTDACLTLECDAPDVTIRTSRPGIFTFSGSALATSVALRLRMAGSAAAAVPLNIPMPLLRWSIIENRGADQRTIVWAGSPQTLPLAWVEQVPAPQLIVDVEGLDAHWQLQGKLELQGAADAHPHILRSRGRRGRQLIFNLREALDTLRSSRSGAVSGTLVLDELPGDDEPPTITAVVLQQTLDVQDLQIDHMQRDGAWQISVRWRGGRALRNRVLRFWSLTRPWAQPWVQPLSDDVHDRYEVLIPMTLLPSGICRVELTTIDPWVSAQPLRPLICTDDMLDVELGDELARTRYLQTLDQSPCSVLERLLLGDLPASGRQLSNQQLHLLRQNQPADILHAAIVALGDTGAHIQDRETCAALFRRVIVAHELNLLVQAVDLSLRIPVHARAIVEGVLWTLKPPLGMLLHEILEHRYVYVAELRDQVAVLRKEDQAALTASFLDCGITVIEESHEVLTPSQAPSLYDELPEWLLDGSNFDSVRLYLREIGQFPLLTTEQEQRLAYVMQDGRSAKLELETVQTSAPLYTAMLEERIQRGEEARTQLIQANLRLVVSVAKRYLGGNMPFLDIVQEGNIGLIKAIEKFDPQRGYKLSTYATWWIRQGISRARADQSRLMRLPVHMYERVNQLRRAFARLSQELNREPTNGELADALGWTDKRLRAVQDCLDDATSLDLPVGDDEGSMLGDFIADEYTLDIGEQLEQNELHTAIEELIQSDLFTWRERVILMNRFGFGDDHVKTLEEIGKMLQVTRERIRQIEVKALRKLKLKLTGRPFRQKFEGYFDAFATPKRLPEVTKGE